MTYPETKRVDVIEEHFDVKIIDAYRGRANAHSRAFGMPQQRAE